MYKRESDKQYASVRVKAKTRKRLMGYKKLLGVESADEVINIALTTVYDYKIVKKNPKTECIQNGDQGKVSTYSHPA